MNDESPAHTTAAAASRPEPLIPIPSAVVGSPAQIGGDADVPFWKPRWSDGLKYLGWRWWLLLPAVILLALLVIPFFLPGLRYHLIWRFEYKLAKWAIIIPIYMFLHIVRKSIQLRKEPFCIHCGYNLTGLPDRHRCPECGRPYAWSVIDEYRRDPEGFQNRWRALRQLPENAGAFDAGTVKRKRRARDGTE